MDFKLPIYGVTVKDKSYLRQGDYYYDGEKWTYDPSFMGYINASANVMKDKEKRFSRQREGFIANINAIERNTGKRHV